MLGLDGWEECFHGGSSDVTERTVFFFPVLLLEGGADSVVYESRLCTFPLPSRKCV